MCALGGCLVCLVCVCVCVCVCLSVQAGATNKCQDGFEAMLKQVMQGGSDLPFIITEFGQTCCATGGACESCPPTYDGKPMGCVRVYTCGPFACAAVANSSV